MVSEMAMNLAVTFWLKEVMALMRSAVDGFNSVHEVAAPKLASLSSVANSLTAHSFHQVHQSFSHSFPLLCCSLSSSSFYAELQQVLKSYLSGKFMFK